MILDANCASFWPLKQLVIENTSIGAKHQCMMKFKVTLAFWTNSECRCQLGIIVASKTACDWKYEYGCQVPMLDEIWSFLPIWVHYAFTCPLLLVVATRISRVWQYWYGSKMHMLHNILSINISIHRWWIWMPIAPQSVLCISSKNTGSSKFLIVGLFIFSWLTYLQILYSISVRGLGLFLITYGMLSLAHPTWQLVYNAFVNTLLAEFWLKSPSTCIWHLGHS